MTRFNALLVASFAALVVAAPMPAAFAEDEGAAVYQDFRCSLSTVATGLPQKLFTQQSHATKTPSGNSVVVCHFDVPEGLAPSEAIVNEGLVCNTPAGRANKMRVVITPSGEATLTCHVNGTP